MELKVRGPDPTLVARVANEWAQILTTQSDSLFSSEAQHSYAFFDSRVREPKSQLESAEEALRAFDVSSRLGVLKAEVEAITGQIAAFESRLVNLDVALQRAETELAQTQVQLRGQPRTLVLSKSITTDPFLHQGISEALGRNFLELSRLQLKSEELNPVYVNLEQAEVSLSVQVAALKSERARVSQAITQLNHELSNLAQATYR